MNPTEQKLDQIFHLWQQGLCPGGQVLVSHRGKVIYDKCFGYANLEHQVPITQDTVFHVASVSKQITVLCALLLNKYRNKMTMLRYPPVQPVYAAPAGTVQPPYQQPPMR